MYKKYPKVRHDLSVTWQAHARAHAHTSKSPFFEFVLPGQCEVPMMLCGRL